MKNKKPNLLFIWTDEQRADTMACYGNNHIKTPALNSLAEKSFVFQNSYCVQPVCTPSRASILTGLYPQKHKCIKNNTPLGADTPTLAEMLDKDYHNAYYGKWHLGDEIIPQHGFHDWVSIEDDIYREFYSKEEYLNQRSDYHHFLISKGFTPNSMSSDGANVFSRSFAANLSERFTKASFLAEKTVDFLKNPPADQSWYLNINFLEPHMPFTGPLNDQYDPEDIPHGESFMKIPPSNHSSRNQCYSEKYKNSNFKRTKANYYGLVSLVDSALEKILQALESSNQLENTIIVYTSDHGDMMGNHAQIAKCVMYEEATKIPLLIHVPWLSKKQINVEGRISQIDLLPTLLDLMNQKLPQDLQGQSRKKVLENQGHLKDNDVFIQWNSDDEANDSQDKDIIGQYWRSIIANDRWKLNYCQTDQSELFDLKNDPNEMNNLFNNKEYSELITTLKEKIHQWQIETDDIINILDPVS